MHAILLSHLVYKVKFYCRQKSHSVTTQPLLVPLRHYHNLPVAVGKLCVYRENKTKMHVLLKLRFLHRIQTGEQINTYLLLINSIWITLQIMKQKSDFSPNFLLMPKLYQK